MGLSNKIDLRASNTVRFHLGIYEWITLPKQISITGSSNDMSSIAGNRVCHFCLRI